VFLPEPPFQTGFLQVIAEGLQDPRNPSGRR
jgi:hypothetical protein